jgi:hypothetical protein
LAVVTTLLAALAGTAALPTTASAAQPADVFLDELVNYNSGYCLATSLSPNEQPVVQTSCGSQASYWDIYDEGGNQQEIQSSYGNYKCVAARGFSESPAVATGCNFGFADQLWRVSHDYTNDVYQFQNVNSGLCLAVRGTASGTRAIQTTCGSWADQWWYLAG